MQHLHLDFDAVMCMNRTFFSSFFLGSICTSDRCAHFISKSSIHIQLHFHHHSGHNELPCVLGCAVCVCVWEIPSNAALHIKRHLWIALCRTFNTFMLSCQPDGCVCSWGKLFLIVWQMKAFKARWYIYSFVRGGKNGLIFLFFNSCLYSKLRQSWQRGEFKGVEVGGWHKT